MSIDPSPNRRRPLRRFLRNWLERHQHPFSFWIHLIGIPLAFAGIVMFFTSPWPWALAAVVAGYALQWLGHLVEGNDMGEWAGIKRMLGLPYVAISPRWQKGSPLSPSPPGTPGGEGRGEGGGIRERPNDQIPKSQRMPKLE